MSINCVVRPHVDCHVFIVCKTFSDQTNDDVDDE